MELLSFDADSRDGETIGDLAFHRLRSYIVNGRLEPLEKLKPVLLRAQ